MLAVLLMGGPLIAAAAIGSLPVIIGLTALSGAGEATGRTTPMSSVLPSDRRSTC